MNTTRARVSTLQVLLWSILGFFLLGFPVFGETPLQAATPTDAFQSPPDPDQAQPLAPDVWRPLGPDGGEAQALAVSPLNPEVVFAGSSGGRVFYSDDSGESWSALDGEGSVPLGSHIFDLAVVPGDPLRLLAATDLGFYRWTQQEAGQGSWENLSDGLPSQIVARIAVSPYAPDTLFITVSAGRITGSWSIFRSVDGGQSWVNAFPGGYFDFPIALARSANGSGLTLWAASFQGVHRSLNLGTSWEIFDEGITQYPNFTDIQVDS